MNSVMGPLKGALVLAMVMEARLHLNYYYPSMQQLLTRKLHWPGSPQQVNWEITN